MWREQQADGSAGTWRARSLRGCDSGPATAPSLLDERLAAAFADNAEQVLPVSLVLIAIDMRADAPHGAATIDAVAFALGGIGRRAADCLAHVESATFALLLPRTHATGAQLLAQRCAAAIATCGGDAVTASIGVATAVAPGIDDDPRALFATAGRLLRSARDKGGDRIICGAY